MVRLLQLVAVQAAGWLVVLGLLPAAAAGQDIEGQALEQQADSLHEAGDDLRTQGRYGAALNRYQGALALSRETEDRDDVGLNLMHVGLVYYRQGRYEKAADYFEQTLSAYRATGDRVGMAAVLNNLGNVREDQGRLDEALDRFREAMGLNRSAGRTAGVAYNYNNIGNVYRKKERYVDAREAFESSLRLSREAEEPGVSGSNLGNLAIVHRALGEYDAAIQRLEEALTLHRRLEMTPFVAMDLANLGNAYLSAGRLVQAADTLERALEITNQLRRQTSSPEARRTFLSQATGRYQSLVSTYVRLDRPSDALRTIEQMRARLLAERLRPPASPTADSLSADSTAKLPSSPSPTALRQLLQPDEAAVLYANSEAPPQVAVVVTRQDVRALTLPAVEADGRSADRLLDRLDEVRPPASRETSVRAALHAPTLDPGDDGLSSLLQRYRQLLTVPTDQLARTRPALADSVVQAQEHIGRALYDALLAPLDKTLSEVETLTLVPSGVLGYLPFETLLDDQGHYLVETHHVRYVPSLRVLHALDERTHPPRPRNLLAVGGARYEVPSPPSADSLGAAPPSSSVAPPTDGARADFDDRQDLRSARDRAYEHLQEGNLHASYRALGYNDWPSLPGTHTEVRLLQRIVPQSQALYRAEASEVKIKRLSRTGQLRNYRWLHFATHGFTSPVVPELSSLVLSQHRSPSRSATSESGPRRSPEDGFLTMAEIARLNLRADVAVLSACQTGLGRIYGGEGVVNLAHAFFQAGANGAAVSLWKVLDASTREFMQRTYRRASLPGTSFAEALTQTKRAFLSGEAGAHRTAPLYWAPFVYYGQE